MLKKRKSFLNRSSEVLCFFSNIWKQLFTSGVHLDSALSKLPDRSKSILAQIIPPLLLRPASMAQALGIGILEGEPWNLSLELLSQWRPAYLMAEKIYERMTEKWPNPLPIKEDFPPFMLKEWEQAWGKAVSKELMQILSMKPSLCIRASTQIGALKLLDALKKEKSFPVKVGLSRISPAGVVFSDYVPILGTESYQKGLFEIQDEGSQFMVHFALNPQIYGDYLQKCPGQSVLVKLDLAQQDRFSFIPKIVIDACAGAGGKTLALADALSGKHRVYAYDVSLKKLKALKRRMRHAGFNNIQTLLLKEGEEQAQIEGFKEKAGLVLVDAPCSGWGVLRRNPDIKWRQNRAALERMPLIQERLLSLFAQLVEPGGRLVYGVCTFRPEETWERVEEFLKIHPDFSAIQGGFLGPGPCDGFFMQAFIKKQCEK